MTARAPVKSVNKTPAQIAANAAAEKERKATSKAALRDAVAPRKVVVPKTAHTAKVATAEQVVIVDRRAPIDPNAAMHAAWVVDAKAVHGEDATPAQIAAYIKEQETPVESATGYNGPMLALRTAAKHYVKGANGNPHCNDWLAEALAGLTREQVCNCLIEAMKLPNNPYLHLNPGQQSMNLRNKARGMAKSGTLTDGDVTAAIERLSRRP